MTLRCAIYTRKSSDEGLEQAFNSLHAQREACEAYILSQRDEGWSLQTERYDDGAFSGGNLRRPALQRLLEDVRARRIDIVVVYKVDRLSRALGDFARLIEEFEKRSVAFVSVTQPFNTTTSMGRLTLNVLLSFAQFEREVTGERIRDKIAASKAKGMWMGGVVPLGFDVPSGPNRALVVNELEAATVRRLFNRYLELGNLGALVRWADDEGIRSKSWISRRGRAVGGCAFTTGALRHLLANPVYVGELRHKKQRYPARHPAILERPLFDAVQDIMSGRSEGRRNHVSRARRTLLHGRIFDASGDPMQPTFGNRGGRTYSYYASSPLPGEAVDAGGDVIRRVPCRTADDFALSWAARLLDLVVTEVMPTSVHKLFKRIEIHPSSVQLVIELRQLPVPPKQAVTYVRARLEPGERTASEPTSHALMRIVAPVRLVSRGGRAWVISSAASRVPDAELVKSLRRGHAVLRECGIDRGAIRPMFSARAPRDQRSRDLAVLSFLAPDLQREILRGEIVGVELGKVPLSWAKQRELSHADAAPVGSVVFRRNRA